MGMFLHCQPLISNSLYQALLVWKENWLDKMLPYMALLAADPQEL